MRLLASIPSPGSGAVDLGPLTLHMYGLTLLLAIVACVWITGRRWIARGGDWDLIFRCAVWGVAFGIIGARLYHVATSWNEVPDEWWGPFAIWKGGLGVWGGIALGVLAGYVIARRAGANTALLADCLAPGLLVAQGIGRFGNWWNQELFGRPTDLPWGLEIDPENRPIAYLDQETFHPTFLYEALWNFAAAGPCSWSSVASGSGRPDCSRSTSASIASAASGSSSSGWTPRTRSRACASTPGWRRSGSCSGSSPSFSSSAAVCVGGARRAGQGRADDGRPEEPRPTGELGSSIRVRLGA